MDPNDYDIRMMLHGTEWMIAELLRLTEGLSMQEAGELIEMVHAPVGTLVEDFGNRSSVSNAPRDLWRRKLVEGNAKDGYRLTQSGFASSVGIIRGLL